MFPSANVTPGFQLESLSLGPHRIRLVIRGGLQLTDLQAFSAAQTDWRRQWTAAAVEIDLSGLTFVDSAGALALQQLLADLRREGRTCQLLGVRPQVQQLLALIDYERLQVTPAGQRNPQDDFITQCGAACLELLADFQRVISFFGELLIDLVAVLAKPRRVRWSDVVFYMRRAGVEGLPIVSLIALLLGLIIAFMSSLQLKQFGANIYVASLLAIAMVRELGPIMTAILVAGRSGSAFAAEIGTMKVNEEVDALIVIGLEPITFLAVPKVLASMVVVPLLTVYADLVGILGGLLVGVLLLDLTVYSYIQETKAVLTLFDFTTSFLKSLVFAFLIAGIGCQRGFQVRGGAAAVGAATTSAVVAAIFLIILVDSIFAIVLTYI